jgi:hypothetical protein
LVCRENKTSSPQSVRRPTLLIRKMEPHLAIQDDQVTLSEAPRTLEDMSGSAMLTKRRAVDHCRTRSSLCRMSLTETV